MSYVKTGMRLVHRAFMLKAYLLDQATLTIVAIRASHFVSARHDSACTLRVRTH